MPRRKKNRKSKGRGRGRGRSGAPTRGNNESNGSKIRQTFSYHTRFVGSATVAGVDFTPFSNTFFGPDVANMLNLYQEYRCCGLRVTMYPTTSLPTSSGNSDTGLAIGWRPMQSGVSPTTVDHIVQSTKFAYMNDALTIPVTFIVTGAELRRHMLTKWLHTTTTGQTELRTHGAIWYADIGTNAGTIVWTWLIESTWEFQSPIPIGQFLTKMSLVIPAKYEALKAAPGSAKCDDLDQSDEKSEIIVT